MKKLIYSLALVLILNSAFNIQNLQSQWITNGPFNHNVGAMVVGSGNVYALCGDNVFCSVNNGSSWFRTVLQNELTAPRCITTTGTSTIFVGTTANVFRSQNGGQSWQKCGTLNKTITALTVLGPYVYAATYTGVYRCPVNDTLWQSSGLFNKNITALYNNGTDMYAARLYLAGTGPTIYKYTNSDTSWNLICSINDTSSITSMIVSPPNIIVAKTGVVNGNGVFRSVNNGANWSRILTAYGFSLLSSSGNVYAGMADGIYLSQTGGATFTKMMNLSSVGAVSMCLSGSNVFAGVSGFITELEGGIYKSSNNGSNWFMAGLNSLTFNSFTESGGYIIAACDTMGVYRSTNNGLSWTSTVMGRAWYANAVAMSGTTIIVGTMQGVYKLPNYGSAMNNISNGGYIYSVAVSGTNIFAGKRGDGIHKTTNEGSNWTKVGLTNKSVRALVVTPSSVLAGVDSSGGVYRSADNGANWSQTNTSLTVYSLFYSNNVFAGTSSGVYKSTDDGLSFNLLGLSGKTVRGVSVTNGIIFAGTLNDGLYCSTDGGSTWSQKNEGFDASTSVYSVFSNSSVVLSGTKGRSVWSRAFSQFVGIRNISTEIPSAYSLGQNYPNPFNPKTVIRFGIPGSVSSPRGLGGDLVQLKVFDIMGREVATLVNEQLAPGTYETTFDGSALSSGTYFYKLTSGDFSQTKRLTLLK